MIVEFSVKNYRSIRDMQTLSFRATDIVSNQEKYPEIDKNNIVDVNGTRLLKTVGIYGANASGKSNVVRAFLDFCKVVGALQQPSGEILKDLAQPFLYNEDTKDTDSYFQLIFMLEGKKYRYGFTVAKKTIAPYSKTEKYEPYVTKTNTLHAVSEPAVKYAQNHNAYQITYEWLYSYENENKTQLFLRKGKEVENDLPDKKQIPDVPFEHTLFLTYAASHNDSVCAAIWNLVNKITTINNGFNTNYLLDNEEDKVRLISYLSYFDLDYTDIYKVESNIDKSVKIYLKKWRHLGDATFELDTHESMGTRRIYELAGSLITMFEQEESNILVLDEIDSNLHSRLVIRLIEMFNDPEINKSKSQLLFTSHDTNLMKPSIMRRDQFYFTEKNQEEETCLDSLSDLKGIPNDADFARQYLAGIYGGVPTLRNSQFEPIAEDA